MTRESLWRGVLIVVLCVALARPVNAEQKIGYSGPIVAPIVGAVAAIVVIVVVVIHYSKKRTVTGCVNSAGSGMTVTDEKDRQTYALSGDTTDIKAGDRMKLRGKRIKSKGPGKTAIWETKAVAKDYGVCHP